MLEIYNNSGKNINKISLVPNSMINKTLYSQLDLVKSYMYNESFFVDNKHPFVSILNNIVFNFFICNSLLRIQRI